MATSWGVMTVRHFYICRSNLDDAPMLWGVGNESPVARSY
jgi:hypothetical protein